MTDRNRFFFELRERYRDGKVLPFIGAGASMAVKWTADGVERHGPSWSELVDEAARQMGFEPRLLRVRANDLQILEYYSLRNQGLQKLTNWFVTSMQPPDAALVSSPIHRALAHLDRCSRVYTTNYDDFLERALRLHGRPARTVALEPHIVDATAGGVEVVKFHGDWNYPETMVVSERHYEERLKLDTAMDFRLRSDVLNRVLLFVGYSFRDYNVSYLFRLIKERFGQYPANPPGLRAFIITQEPSVLEYDLFGARGIGVIPVDSRDVTRQVALALEDLEVL